MSGTRYRTSDGDTLDYICFNFYGYTAGSLDAVYEANPGIENENPFLPAGIEVVLPELVTSRSSDETPIRLWD